MKSFQLHPATIKYLGLGHFWVTHDTFSKRIPPQEEFFIGTDQQNKPVGLFFQDFGHKEVKGRLWAHPKFIKADFQFLIELNQRIEKAIKKRSDFFEKKERENFHLAFGEADLLPGLLILNLKNHVLIQTYSTFWNKYIQEIKKALIEFHPLKDQLNIWFQSRDFVRKNNIEKLHGEDGPEFTLNEFGLLYKINLSSGYDFGIYTDMTHIRQDLKDILAKKQDVLNLFSYTGALSLFSMKQNGARCTSIDLSSKYLDWLDQNIELNSQLKKENHTRIDKSSIDGMKSLKSQNKTFDLIICDPPSSSSDGDKRVNALKSYEDMLPLMTSLLNEKGTLVIFLNTHSISWKKFETDILAILDKQGISMSVTKKLYLGGDCPRVKGFIEGDYLKGLVLDKK